MNISLKESTAHFDDFLSQADEKLFSLADKAATNSEQRHYFEARQTLNKSTSPLKSTFKQSLLSSFKRFTEHKITITNTLRNSASEEATLSLVADDELEEALALTSMSQKQESRQAENLYALNQRLAVIRGGKRLQQHESPIEPVVFADALQRTFSQLNFSTKTKLIIYKLFDQHFMPHLEELYSQLNNQLIEAGVLPHLAYKIQKQASRQNDAASKPDSKVSEAIPDLTSESPNEQERHHSTGGMNATQQGSPGAAAPVQPHGAPASQTEQTGVSENTGLVQNPQTAALIYFANPEQSAQMSPGIIQRAEGETSHSTSGGMPSINHHNAPENTSISPSEAIQQQLISAINKIQQQQISKQTSQENTAGTNSATDGAITTNQPISFKTSELADVLGSLQLQRAQTFDSYDATELPSISSTELHQERRRVAEQLRKADPDKTIKQLDLDTIEVVGLLFEYMLNEEHLPDKAKALISYLHTPFLKVALLDQDFFNHPQHPARQLLNKLVEAGICWMDPEKDSRSKVFSQMKTTVHRAMNDFNNDIAIFTKLAFEFSAFITQHERRIKLAEDRARQSAKGEDRLREIRQQVIDFIKEKSSQLRLPLPIKTLLFEPWANFLQFNLLRFGKQSQQWMDAAQVVDELLWIITPKHTPEEKKQADALQNSLALKLRTGFDTVGYDEAKGAQLIRSIALCQKLSSEDIDSNDDDNEPVPISQPSKDPKRNELKPFLDLLSKIDFGTWFVFDARNKPNKLAKLVWYNVKTNHYMFVNKLGQQIKVCSAEELAENMKSGDTQLMDSKHHRPFFEKALESILEQMQSKKNNGHTPKL